MTNQLSAGGPPVLAISPTGSSVLKTDRKGLRAQLAAQTAKP